MRKLCPSARGLDRVVLLLAALFMASPFAFAAHPLDHKPYAATANPDGASTANVVDATLRDKTPVKPDDAIPVKPNDETQIRANTPPTSEALHVLDHKQPSEPDAPLVSNAPLEPHSEDLAHRDYEELGRREAARVAANRIEVAVLASMDIGSRRFTYSDPVGTLLRPYRLPAAPMASFGLEAYPLASIEVPVLRDLGLRGRVSRAFAVNSNTPAGVQIATNWTRFGGELRERIFDPGAQLFEFGICAGAEASYFAMSTKTSVAALLPTAQSISLRFGFDTRLLITRRSSLTLGAAYLVTTSPGEIYDRFREPHVAGIDVDLGGVLDLATGLEARLTGRYTRYFASFKPAIGDPAVAGGALEEQLQFGLGVRYAH